MASKVRLIGPIPTVLETAQLMGVSGAQVRRLEELLDGNGDSKLHSIKHVRKVAVAARTLRKPSRKTI
jgi:hypothetical protein